MKFVIAVTMDRTDRVSQQFYRLQVRPGYNQMPVMIGPKLSSVDLVERSAASLFGSIRWSRNLTAFGIVEPYVIEVALMESGTGNEFRVFVNRDGHLPRVTFDLRAVGSFNPLCVSRGGRPYNMKRDATRLLGDLSWDVRGQPAFESYNIPYESVLYVARCKAKCISA